MDFRDKITVMIREVGNEYEKRNYEQHRRVQELERPRIAGTLFVSKVEEMGDYELQQMVAALYDTMNVLTELKAKYEIDRFKPRG